MTIHISGPNSHYIRQLIVLTEHLSGRFRRFFQFINCRENDVARPCTKHRGASHVSGDNLKQIVPSLTGLYTGLYLNNKRISDGGPNSAHIADVAAGIGACCQFLFADGDNAV